MSGNSYWQVILAFIMIKLKVLIRNPLGTMVYLLFGQWYFMTTIAAIVVVYGVFFNLDGMGFFAWFKETLGNALDVTKSIAWNCTAKIGDLDAMWECVSDPPKWDPPEEVKIEKDLLEQVDKIDPDGIFSDRLEEGPITPYEEK